MDNGLRFARGSSSRAQSRLRIHVYASHRFSPKSCEYTTAHVEPMTTVGIVPCCMMTGPITARTSGDSTGFLNGTLDNRFSDHSICWIPGHRIVFEVRQHSFLSSRMKSLETESEPSVHIQPGNLSRFSIRFLLVIVFLAAVCLAILVPFVGLEIPGPTSWDLTSGKNIKWKALVGSPTYSNPVVHAGFVFVGTNNQGGHDPLLNPTIDAGVMICFDKETGEFLWQYASPKLAVGGAQDWPTFGITSQPCAIGSRMWFVTNRCEVVCLDTGGFRDGQNAGPFQNEKTTRDIDADVVWKFDMIGNLGVYPHNISHCNVVVDETLNVTTDRRHSR